MLTDGRKGSPSGSPRVVLIDPPPKRRVERHDTPDFPHLGLGYIAAYLRSKGVDCRVIDGKFEVIGLDEVERRLRAISPDIVGITSMTHEIQSASDVAQLAKEALPGSLTVIGGAHATALPAETLAEFPAFDVAVSGEGEHALFELVNARRNNGDLRDGIKGLSYRVGNDVRVNEPSEPIRELDELPFPAWELYPRSAAYPIITSRGCPFKCNFCMRMMGTLVRKRTVEDVLNELKRLCDTYSPRVIHFLDLIIESGYHRRMKWDAQTRADLVDYSLLKRMKAAGCEWLGLGIESGNEQILKASGKGITLNQARNAVEMARRAGLKTDAYFIIGHPFETHETAMDTIRFAQRLRSTRATFGIMVPYPSTEVYDLAQKGEGGYALNIHGLARFQQEHWEQPGIGDPGQKTTGEAPDASVSAVLPVQLQIHGRCLVSHTPAKARSGHLEESLWHASSVTVRTCPVSI